MKRILTIDDDSSALRSLRNDIEKIMGLVNAKITAEAQSLEEAKRLLSAEVPPFDLVITDLRFRKGETTELDGLKIIELCRSKQPKLKVLVVTYDTEFSWYHQVIKVLAADGLLSKNYEMTDLASAIQTITDRNLTYLSPQLAAWLQTQNQNKLGSDDLSNNAKTIINLVKQGKTYKEVALLTKQSEANVKKVIKGLFDLHNVNKIASLLTVFAQKGIKY